MLIFIILIVSSSFCKIIGLAPRSNLDFYGSITLLPDSEDSEDSESCMKELKESIHLQSNPPRKKVRSKGARKTTPKPSSGEEDTDSGVESDNISSIQKHPPRKKAYYNKKSNPSTTPPRSSSDSSEQSSNEEDSHPHTSYNYKLLKESESSQDESSQSKPSQNSPSLSTNTKDPILKVGANHTSLLPTSSSTDRQKTNSNKQTDNPYEQKEPQNNLKNTPHNPEKTSDEQLSKKPFSIPKSRLIEIESPSLLPPCPRKYRPLTAEESCILQQAVSKQLKVSWSRIPIRYHMSFSQVHLKFSTKSPFLIQVTSTEITKEDQEKSLEDLGRRKDLLQEKCQEYKDSTQGKRTEIEKNIKTTDSQIERIRKKLDKAITEYNKLAKKSKETGKNQKDFPKKLSNLRDTKEKLQTELEQKQQHSLSLTRELQKIQAEITTLENQEDQLSREIKQRKHHRVHHIVITINDLLYRFLDHLTELKATFFLRQGIPSEKSPPYSPENLEDQKNKNKMASLLLATLIEQQLQLLTLKIDNPDMLNEPAIMYKLLFLSWSQVLLQDSWETVARWFLIHHVSRMLELYPAIHSTKNSPQYKSPATEAFEKKFEWVLYTRGNPSIISLTLIPELLSQLKRLYHSDPPQNRTQRINHRYVTDGSERGREITPEIFESIFPHDGSVLEIFTSEFPRPRGIMYISPYKTSRRLILMHIRDTCFSIVTHEQILTLSGQFSSMGVPTQNIQKPQKMPVYKKKSPTLHTSQSISHHTSQSIPPHTSQSIPSNASQSIPSNTSQRIPPHTSQSIPPHTSQSIPPHTSQRIPSNASQSIPSNTSQRIPPHTSQSIPPHTSQRIPPHTSQRIPSNASQSIPSNTSQRIPPHTSQSISHHTSQRIPPHTSQRIPSNASQSIPSNTSQRIPPHTSQSISHHTSQSISHHASPKVPIPSDSFTKFMGSLTSLSPQLIFQKVSSRHLSPSILSFQTVDNREKEFLTREIVSFNHEHQTFQSH